MCYYYYYYLFCVYYHYYKYYHYYYTIIIIIIIIIAKPPFVNSRLFRVPSQSVHPHEGLPGGSLAVFVSRMLMLLLDRISLLSERIGASDSSVGSLRIVGDVCRFCARCCCMREGSPSLRKPRPCSPFPFSESCEVAVVSSKSV